MISKEKVIEILDKPEIYSSINKYLEIMFLYKNSENLANDYNFQKKYNHFYRMGRRTKDFYNTYYCYMEKIRDNKNITFNEIFNYIKSNTNRNEASFSSKLLHTINNDMPILDSIVLKNLNLYNEYKSRKSNKTEIYDKLNSTYKELSYTHKYIVDEFNRKFLDIKISDIKKIDFVLWQLR